MKFVWQVLALVAVFIGCQGIMSLAAGMPWLELVGGMVACTLAVLVYRFVVGRTEHRSVTELGGVKVGRRLALGSLIGFGLCGVVIAAIAALGYYRIGGFDSWTGAVGLAGVMAVAATTEDLLFRGVLFRKVEEWTGTWISIAGTSLLFGAVHLINPHATLWGALLIALTGGPLVTSAFIATRNLWLSIGLHFSWNFALGGIFSTDVGGNTSRPGLLDSATFGPELITGGKFGPEGSIFTLIFCALATAVFLLVAHRRGRLVPFRRSERVRVLTQLARQAAGQSDGPRPNPSGHDTYAALR
ncbi:CPBP family intramembrane glutamic endopeptidase [Occultella gossypii]|uniref:CPBP family intramembrane metalloprotease n=1 Tax=Occultella gossypii TaxID=2800820 RepID=A0ABS7SGS3_9MICO|nr:CPBP family intramembrane glutamic endopeptidase [Occultella gossypii]MBZ2199562.1 CPBP family intramembrane metalloprotease [Occultella gossypii]